MSVRLEWLPPDQLPSRRRQLEEILLRSPQAYTLDWIYRRANNENLCAATIFLDDDDIGLALVAVDESQPRRTLYLFGISARGEGSWMRDFSLALRAFAKNLGCEVIQGVAGPKRKGWRRYARPVATIYEVEV